ncbi:plasmid mobilization protein [Methanobrevibacter sp.]|uniref:plasmid mobilization protein n=1 Tax=Methanobrevibacter sp. TaxID=66852 RepID=UPI003863964A
MSEENKSQRITLRVSPKEKEELEKRAEQAKMSLSQYLIRAGENKKITVAENIPELFLEITRIGVNINQIAHVANSQKYVNTQQIYELKRLLREVQGDMEKIIKALGNNEEVTNDNLKEILLMVEKRMSGMERRISKFEMNFDQASYHVDERLDKIYKKIENGDTDE